MEKLKQSINDYEKQMVVFNDALENYRKKRNLPKTWRKQEKNLRRGLPVMNLPGKMGLLILTDAFRMMQKKARSWLRLQKNS